MNHFRNQRDKVTSQRFYITRSPGVVFLLFLYGVLSLARGQQTIFNVPTTDVLEKGKVYAELDASLKPTGQSFLPAGSGLQLQLRRTVQNIEREQSMPKPAARQPKLRWDVWLNDLSLFASLCLAQWMVRRTLRRQRQERAERLKRIKLVLTAGEEVPNKVCVDH
jgi:hypothetical protein